ncbi:ABC transporter permease [Xiamenia xianingshaonis]|uniref:ABC transporter permease n=1 Tax=Xiamenia xianingshaonis TaxID=2682776 RepID=UPI00140998E6|nr:ABC transporter permease [Xiamenia xianingshaonis]
MQVFKCLMRIIRRNAVYLLIYVVALSFMGVAMAANAVPSQAESSDPYERAALNIAMVDRDGSTLSHGIADFLATQGTIVDVEDDALALQDAVAKGEVEYLLIVPQGYEEAFVEAVQEGDDLPQMEAVYSYYARPGALEDASVASYVGLVSAYLTLGQAQAAGGPLAAAAAGAAAPPEGAAPEDVAQAAAAAGAEAPAAGAAAPDGVTSAAEGAAPVGVTMVPPAEIDDAAIADAVDAALDAAAEKAPVELVRAEGEVQESAQFSFYLKFSSYGIFAAIVACVGAVMSTVNAPEVRRRHGASPLSTLSLNVQMALACLVVTLLAWGWTFGLGLVVFGDSAAAAGTCGVALMALVLFVFSLVPLGIALLVGLAGASTVISNAVGNICGLVVSFFGGAWVPLSLVGPEIQAAAHFLPGYWFTTAIDLCAQAPLSGDAWATLGVCLAVLLLFAAVFTLAGLLVGRLRSQSSGSGAPVGALADAGF